MYFNKLNKLKIFFIFFIEKLIYLQKIYTIFFIIKLNINNQLFNPDSGIHSGDFLLSIFELIDLLLKLLSKDSNSRLLSNKVSLFSNSFIKLMIY